ncbi:MAG: radical SAM protein, partial [Deltaproteobacteria bacterium]|nr:radical SAM protein [Deltaproteobacteria bacterium]
GRSLGTVRALQDRGVDVQVVVTLLQGYEMDFAAVRDGLRSLGVRRVAINELAEIGCATACSLEDLRLEDGALREQWRAAFGEHPPHRGGSPADPVCLAGRSSVYIGPDGTVRPCLDWPLALGNVRERPLAELWRDHPALAGLRSLTWGSLEGSCARCGDRPWCFFCPARALRETGSSTGAAPSLCRRAAIWRSLEGSP